MMSVVMRRAGAVLVAAGLLFSPNTGPATAANTGITVTTLVDVSSNDGTCSLREAIIAANSNIAVPGAVNGECVAGSDSTSDEITFSVAGTISLGSNLPAITSDLSIDGAGKVTVDGVGLYQPFNISSGTVRLNGLTISGGSAPIEGGGVANAATLTITSSTLRGNVASVGGGIYNTGELTVADANIIGNTADRYWGCGGGIANAGTLVISNTIIDRNTATSDGGGICAGRYSSGAASGGAVTISTSTIGANVARGNGGGIYDSSVLTVRDSTITGNATSANGGGIAEHGGAVTISDSTIGGNTAALFGGGIEGNGDFTVQGVTVSANMAKTGGGIYSNGPTGPLVVTNTTISDNTAIADGGGIGLSGLPLSQSLILTNSTISGNAARVGGGIAVGSTPLVVPIRNSIIAGNDAPSFRDIQYFGQTRWTRSIVGVPAGKTLADIFAGGLADHGGPTETIALALKAGNPAIDTADTRICAAAPVSDLDQRGMTRPVGAGCDVGAYEAQAPTIAAHADVRGTAMSPSGAVVTYAPPAGTDEQGGPATVACLPASGSTFPVGSTTVSCTATDGAGHTASSTFNVVLDAAFESASPTTTASATARLTVPPTDARSEDGEALTPGLPVVDAILVLLGGLLLIGRPRRRGPTRIR